MKRQSEWKDTGNGDRNPVRSDKETLPLLESFFFNNYISGTFSLRLLLSSAHIIPLVQSSALVAISNIIFLWIFQICEIDLRESLPSDAFTPFMDEIKKREKQRKERAKKVFLFITMATQLTPSHFLIFFLIPTSFRFCLLPFVSI